MRHSKFAGSLAALALLSACGGGSSGSGGNSGPPFAGAPTPSPTVTPAGTACSLAARQEFARTTFNEWYLFPSLLSTTANPASFSSVQSYIDALVAPARAEAKDRFFSYVTSIREENAFFNSGASGGFGFRLAYDTGARRTFVVETFEGTSALGANIDRGSELLAIGTSANNLQTVNSLMANGGPSAVINALGPGDPGVTRVIRLRDQSGVTREVSLTKTDFALDPVSNRFGAQIINDGGKRVGYLNLRTFISTADPDLRAAFALFREQGATELIIDFRYNGGGAITIAELMGDLMGRNLGGQVYERIAFRPSKSQLNETYLFNPRPQSITPSKIAFIGTGSTASASELVINGMQPYVADIALIGENTFGKPVGQSAFDLAVCDDRLRVVTLQIENAAGRGDYFRGLASTVPKTCAAQDDIRFQLGDPRETMVATALDFLAGRPCTPIVGGAATTLRVTDDGLLEPALPQRSVAQHEVPGLF